MIVRPLGDGLLLTTQTDHAALAAEIIALWREDALASHPRRRELLFAVREHDNGWREVDSAPRRREDGRPHDFISLPDPQRRELWDRGVRRWAESEPWASRLILRHALSLHHSHSEQPAWAELLAAWDRLDEGLAERTGTSSADVERDYTWLSLADEISLRLCQGWRGSIERAGRRFDFGPDAVGISPFPLAGATTFRVRGRRLTDEAWPDEVALAVGLASARWESRPLRLTPVASPTEAEVGASP